MRLIDGDALIEKFNEKVDMEECLIDARTAERFATFCALSDAVEEMPTVDAAEVVRCRECNYHNKPPCPMRLSFNWTEDNDFCSYGERKDGDSVAKAD